MKRMQMVSLVVLLLALVVSASVVFAQPHRDGAGGDIDVWDIVDSVADDERSTDDLASSDDEAEGRPAGGGGGGGDIIVFDIVDSVADDDARRSNDEGDVAVVTDDELGAANNDGGGGDIIVFDIVD